MTSKELGALVGELDAVYQPTMSWEEWCGGNTTRTFTCACGAHYTTRTLGVADDGALIVESIHCAACREGGGL